MHAAQSDGQSLESVIEGAPAAEGYHADAPHAGAITHDPNAEHGHGVTTETSVVPAETQGTIDAAERPGAPSTAPTAEHTEAAPGAGTHDRPELDTQSEGQ
jgi:hypothetical protein